MTNQPELRACELKSCPFCGGEAFLAKPYDGRKYVGECLKCGTRRPYAVVTREQAISLWNARSSPVIPEDAYPKPIEEKTVPEEFDKIIADEELLRSAEYVRKSIVSADDLLWLHIDRLINHAIKGRGK